MDLSTLTEEQLEKLAAHGLEGHEDTELEALAQPQSAGRGAMEKDLMQTAAALPGQLSEGIDAFGGDASTRAALSAGLKGESAFEAGLKQYGHSEGAPTGKDIAKQLHFPDKMMHMGLPSGAGGPFIGDEDLGPEVNPAEVAGAGINFAASPSNLLLLGSPIVKGLAKGMEGLSAATKAGGAALGAARPLAASVGSFIAHKMGLPTEHAVMMGAGIGSPRIAEEALDLGAKGLKKLSPEDFKKAFLAAQAARAKQMEQRDIK